MFLLHIAMVRMWRMRSSATQGVPPNVQMGQMYGNSRRKPLFHYYRWRWNIFCGLETLKRFHAIQIEEKKMTGSYRRWLRNDTNWTRLYYVCMHEACALRHTQNGEFVFRNVNNGCHLRSFCVVALQYVLIINRKIGRINTWNRESPTNVKALSHVERTLAKCLIIHNSVRAKHVNIPHTHKHTSHTLADTGR